MSDILGSMNSYRKYSIILCCLALQIALYTVQVTVATKKDPDYKPICDISERYSCSQVFSSNFGTGFGVVDKLFDKTSIVNQPNGVYGIFLYPGILLCCLFSWPIIAKLQMLLTTIGFVVSTYGFINTFYLQPYICVVCVVGHSINYILFVMAVLSYRSLIQSEVRSSAKSKKKN